jgi:acetyltransferase
VLTPRSTEKILNAAGLKLPAQMEVFVQDALKDACEQIGYPLVMKVIGPLHKSDAGGVQVGIKNSDEARSAWKTMLSIEDAKGVLLQPMIEGHEVILGVSREGAFGHLIMFGLGGIYTELFKDVRFAFAPLSIDESENMVKGIKCYPMLEGIRGERGMSINLLTDFLLRLSQLVTDFPIIREIDLNPVKGYDADLYAIDARIIIA